MKQYVLDTNILIESPDAIFGFDDNLVCITMKTLEELDGLKKSSGDTGFNARKAIRNINSLKDCSGNYEAGLMMKKGGIFRILKKPVNIDSSTAMRTIQGFDVNKPDNEILFTIIVSLSSEYENILITNDVSMQVKAELLGIKTQSYHNLRVNETGYRGTKYFDITNWQTIEELYKNGNYIGVETIPELKDEGFVENEYVCLKCGNMKAYTVYRDKKLSIQIANWNSRKLKNRTMTILIVPIVSIQKNIEKNLNVLMKSILKTTKAIPCVLKSAKMIRRNNI